MIFEKIRNINLDNLSELKNKVFITFDLDWCSEEILDYTLNIVEKNKISASFFVTHNTQLLNRMRNNDQIELGIHPNFNNLLDGNYQYGRNVDEVIEHFKNIVPESLSVRSHSLTQSSNILNSFEKFGLKFECNTFVPFSSNIQIYPYRHWTKNLIKVPFFWEDDLSCIYGWEYNVKNFLSYEGIKVFNFHPIHVFLNTKNLDTYYKSKEWQHKKIDLEEYRNQDYGTYNFLMDLIKLSK